MPITYGQDDEGDCKERYLWPARYVTPECAIADSLRQWRRECIKDREEFLSYQKAVASDGEREYVKFFKDCSARELKRQRACTLMLPVFGEPDANQKSIDPNMWPVELVEQLDEISGRIVMMYG